MGEDQVEVSTDPGYALDATSEVPGSPVVTEDGVVVSKEVADQLRAAGRANGRRIHFSKVKEGDVQ